MTREKRQLRLAYVGANDNSLAIYRAALWAVTLGFAVWGVISWLMS